MTSLILVAVIVVCWLLSHDQSESVTFTEGEIRIEDSLIRETL